MTSFADMTRTFGRIGCLSFGGPAAQIALMHKELVETKNWLSEEDFLRALSFCMLLPGPEAMQLATYAGWRLRGIAGGLLAGLLFVGPGAVVIAALVWLYTLFGALPLVQAGFLGIKAAVIVIVVQALARIGRKALKDRTGQAVAIAGFLAVFLLNLPFPLVVALAAGLGLLLRPEMTTPEAETVVHVGRGHWRNVALWAALWLVPLAGLTWIGAEFLATLGWFFAKLAVVTFGGAYAVLAYVTQTVVSDQGWITTGQMIDALGLAETTPGPLVLVTQFVAMLAGHGQGGVGLAVAAGVVALWATFAPCFLWIFAAAPYLEHLTRLPRLQGALSAITAAVAGMMLNLSLWFTLHLLFRELAPTSFGVNLPVWSSLDTHALVLVGLAPLVHRLCGGKLVLLLIVMATVGVLTGAFR
ncbi:putative chromate transport protein [Tritonibacter multivorans]|uniref:Putative chromate transport protein n=2 Tax=Tritonibacter multivorans TaxID=928856 RepID=A0A0P1GYI4_9RHOB|nr:chromate efflux transporter [Tritonibacter multivorans]MDA7421631.1 chromate efflux transporter [Tritonibacter multivorans]CUH82043.1 putative chromate transport protein [Tritonibacter multivorans]SFC93293.1 chromate transporter [Tritonibacter multivorans]